MAITGFKNIIDNKGYKVDDKDREVFEEGIQKSYFGLGVADEIEFVLYDSNDNKLPQGENGDKVRYIKLNSSNIGEYFLMTDLNSNKRPTRASEYIVDVEKLIREAGYSNGVFKTQVTLLNRRAGSEKREGDKLWIHEISPSRTEIRVLPLRSKKIIKDLEDRYTALIEEKEFRDDTIYFIRELAESVTINDVRTALVTEKGTVSQGEKYISLIQQEFKIYNFENFLSKIRDKFLQAVDYYIAGRNYNPNSLNFGKPLGDTEIPIELSLEKIKRDLITILLQCIDLFLVKRNIQDENILTEDEQKTIDKLKEIRRTRTNDNIFESDGLAEEKAVVGCTDPRAKNYNPLAKREDGSCVYEMEDKDVLGCTDVNAINYNDKATEDDGSCRYEERDGKLLFGQKYYIWSFKAAWEWKSENGTIQRGKGREYESFSINHFEGTFKVTGPNADIRKYPKPRPTKTAQYRIKHNVPQAPRPRPEPPVYAPSGVYDSEFFINRQSPDYVGEWYYPRDTILVDDSYQPRISISLPVTYTNELGKVSTTRNLAPGDTITICAREGSVTAPNTSFTITKLGNCGDVVQTDQNGPRPVPTEPTPDFPVPNTTSTTPTPPRVTPSGGGGGGRGSRAVGDDFDQASVIGNPYNQAGPQELRLDDGGNIQ